jgi:hypothetical protein
MRTFSKKGTEEVCLSNEVPVPHYFEGKYNMVTITLNFMNLDGFLVEFLKRQLSAINTG